MNIQGNLVNVFTGDIYPARVTFTQTISSIQEISTAASYILPGFIDAHIHIESSMLCPSRFAEAVIPHGTTCTISDPHEIANVMGLKGITYMIEDSQILRIYYTAPSSVPATLAETSGAVLDPEGIEHLFKNHDLIALGEVMNVPGVIAHQKEIIRKIEIAKKYGKPVDGHAPHLSGVDLQKYVEKCITTDHECTSLKEAEEKQRLGMKIMIREGTAAKNLKDLLGLEYDRCFLVSDDLHPEDLQKGHLDVLLQKAVSCGIDPVAAVKMVTLNPAEHYSLPTGCVAPGRPADMVVVDNLSQFSVKKVFINGELVAAEGTPLFSTKPALIKTTFNVKHKTSKDMRIATECETARVRVIAVVPGQIYTKKEEAVLPCEQGVITSDIEQDIAKLVMVERYGHNNIGRGFVKGFGLKEGALASSVAHDSHNIIAVGVDDDALCKAVNTVIDMKGGIAVSTQKSQAYLELPVAGLMSYEPLPTVAEKYKTVLKCAEAAGCTLLNPFMQLSFLGLLVIPELKLSDKGLFDSEAFKFVDVIV